MEKSIRGDNLFRINSTKGENSKKYLKGKFFSIHILQKGVDYFKLSGGYVESLWRQIGMSSLRTSVKSFGVLHKRISFDIMSSTTSGRSCTRQYKTNNQQPTNNIALIRRNRDGEQMNIGFIGAGKLCYALSFYLQSKHTVGIYSKTYSHAQQLTTELGSKAYTTIGELIADCDFVGISTSDAQISQVVQEIIQHDIDVGEKIIAHFSGAVSSAVLEPLEQRGAVVLSMHPAQSFADPTTAREQLPHTTFTIEGKPPAQEAIQRLMSEFPNERIFIEPSQKGRYHAAAVILSNYLVTLYALAQEQLLEAGMRPNDTEKILIPLLRSTTKNIEKQGFDALTGPLQRGDADTIAHHLQLLAKDREISDLYRCLGRQTHRLLCERGKSSSLAIEKILCEEQEER